MEPILKEARVNRPEIGVVLEVALIQIRETRVFAVEAGLHGIADSIELNRLFTALALNTGGEASIKGLVRFTGLAKNTLKRYLDYLEAAFLTPDTNLVENAIRPFCVGRRNWLFNGSPAGAHAAAALYSLIETAKANNIEPYRYLRHIFEQIPLVKNAADLEALLPYRIDADDLNSRQL